MGTQQLLMDTYSMKTLMLQLPNLHSSESSATINKSTSPVYVKLITAKTTHIEVILKLIGTPDDMLLERFRVMWPDGSPADLQLLMALKGTKRADQQALLELFGLSNNKASKAANAANNSAASSTTAAIASATAASAAASAAAFSSMKSLTQDLSSQARSAVQQMKWVGTNNK
jgi:vacuolar protein sorting-associated protein 53